MGDRGNIYVKNTATSGVFLYGHWSGYDLAITLRDVLKLRKRWNDDQYLARMIFCAMVGDDRDGEHGYGISAEMGDNERRILCVDCDAETVRSAEEGSVHEDTGPTVGFGAFCEFDDDQARRFHLEGQL